MMRTKEIAAHLYVLADELAQAQDTDDTHLGGLLLTVGNLINECKPISTRVFEEMFNGPARIALFRIALDIGLWEVLAKSNNGKTIDDLYRATKVDPKLMMRMVRALVVTGDVVPVCDGRFRNSSFTEVLGTTFWGSGVRNALNVSGEVFHHFTGHLKHNDYMEPVDSSCTGSHTAFNGQGYFEHINADETRLKHWNTSMANHDHPRQWFEQ